MEVSFRLAMHSTVDDVSHLSVLPLALTASSVAFANAGIEMYDVVVAASLVREA